MSTSPKPQGYSVHQNPSQKYLFRRLRKSGAKLILKSGDLRLEPREAKITPKLVAFDVDGTLLRGENICGCIARNIGRTAEMNAFELFRSREEITVGRQTMLEWYSPFSRETLIGYLQDLRLAPGVRRGFARLKEEGIKIALVSITWQFAVDWLAADLGADYESALDGAITVRSGIFGPKIKRPGSGPYLPGFRSTKTLWLR
ncbi:haloacid dehalogenase-like hydrolase [Rhizobium sp. XQZ8]|uniref:HAD family hydrolase n=1 Tax=Rhizobium populisoli TaxID=2859785 RepID=UPI001CA5EFFC|nr:HAD family hydrolase [Rhizobium populisoli]MBW6425887.1 haloacid dehalogenase-like hydrolase [Rhizobium populisoli]